MARLICANPTSLDPQCVRCYVDWYTLMYQSFEKVGNGQCNQRKRPSPLSHAEGAERPDGFRKRRLGGGAPRCVAQKASEYAGHPIDRPDKRTTWRDVETLKSAGYAVETRPRDQGKVLFELEFRAMGAQVPRRCDKNVQVSHGKPGESHNREAQSHGAHRRQGQAEPKATGPAALPERHVQANGICLGANRTRPEQGMENII